ncbi:MAG TPA: hypothetical protein VF699_06785 [Caulobacteraceae bacterium]|jgi:hypothetical protein
MKQYPVSIARRSYRGSDPKRRAKLIESYRVAARIEEYINEELEKLPDDTVKVFLSYAVAASIGESESMVQELIMATDGGSNGITCWKGDYERALANLRKPT